MMNSSFFKYLMLMTLTMGVLCLRVSGAAATTLYVQNFDAAGQAALALVGAGGQYPAPASWSVNAGGDVTKNLTVTDGSAAVAGNRVTGYYASGDGKDYSLGVYKSSAGQSSSIAFTYTATAQVSDIIGAFDLESPFSPFTAVKSRTDGFHSGFQYRVNQDPWITLIDGGALTMNNSRVATAAVWLTDDRMDALGLSIRGLTFSLPGLVLNANDTLSFGWFDNKGGSDKNLLIAVDNFALQGSIANDALAQTIIPLPGTWLLLGTGLLGLGLWRRKNSARG